MKKIIAGIVISIVIFSSCAPAGVVTERPADVYYERPIAPGPGYVWIEGDWIWGGGSYRWHPGYWNRPRPGRSWNSGHWEQHRNGYRWNRGGWRR